MQSTLARRPTIETKRKDGDRDEEKRERNEEKRESERET